MPGPVQGKQYRILQVSCSLVQTLSKTLKHFKLFQFLPKQKGGNAVEQQVVPHAVDTLGAEGDSHILPGAVRKVSQCCLMDKT